MCIAIEKMMTPPPPTTQSRTTILTAATIVSLWPTLIALKQTNNEIVASQILINDYNE